jgi:hypothetical protein
MDQLRRVSTIVAILASVLSVGSGSILFFIVEPPFLASIFLACAAISIGCFVLAGVAAYLEE